MSVYEHLLNSCNFSQVVCDLNLIKFLEATVGVYKWPGCPFLIFVFVSVCLILLINKHELINESVNFTQKLHLNAGSLTA